VLRGTPRRHSPLGRTRACFDRSGVEPQTLPARERTLPTARPCWRSSRAQRRQTNEPHTAVRLRGRDSIWMEREAPIVCARVARPRRCDRFEMISSAPASGRP